MNKERESGTETPRCGCSIGDLSGMDDPIANLPKEKQTVLGLYVTAREACQKWQADPEKVKILYGSVGHEESGGGVRRVDTPGHRF